MRKAIRRVALAAVLLLAPGFGTAHVDAGELIENVELAALAGGRRPLLAAERVNVLVFFRPGQERSLDALKRMAECEAALARKPVQLTGVVSASAPLPEVRAAVAEAGIQSPVLLDEGDRIYGKLELRQHPMIVIVDRKSRAVAFEPHVRLRYCDIVKARIAYLLGEMTQAEVDKVVKPEKARFPNEVGDGAAARYVRLGEKELQKGNCPLALRAFDRALERDPRSQAALAGKARCPQGAARPLPAKAP